MSTIALVLVVVWFLVAFVLRTALQVRRTGDSGVRLGIGAVGSTEWWAAVGFVVSLLVMVAAPIADLAGADLDVIDLPKAVQWFGVAVVVLGIVATFLAQVDMGASWRIGVDEAESTELVSSGAFGVVRNPIFSAMLLTAAGFVLVVPTVLTLVGVVVLVASLELQVRRVEEPYLRRVHGDEYRRYESRVGRFLPGLGVARPV